MTYEEVKLLLDNSVNIEDKFFLVEAIVKKEDDGSYTVINPQDEMPKEVQDYLLKEFEKTLGVSVTIEDPVESLLRDKKGLFEA